MTNKMIFTRIAKFRFNGKEYQMYKSKKGKMAFLEITSDGKYHYPQYEDFCNLVAFFLNDRYDSISYFDTSNHKNYRFMPKLRTKASIIMITSAILLAGLTGCSNVNADYYEQYIPSNNGFDLYGDMSYADETTINTSDSENSELDFYSTEDFEVIKSANYVQLYNNKYFDDLFDIENFTLEEVYDVIENNDNIPNDLKPFICDFVKKMDDYYENLDLRIFYDNIKTMTIKTQNQEDISIMSDGLAFYDHEQNLLVISGEADFYNDDRAQIILRHELAHAFNNAKLEVDGYEIKYTFNDGNRGKYVKEGLDVLFSSYPFLDEYGEDVLVNLGYPITTNIVKTMIESLPNYKIEDSVNHNVYYLQDKINEYMSEDIEASVIIELLELQWLEYASDEIQVDEEEYIDLYGYITRLYIKSHVNENMTYEEIMNLEQQLEEQLVMGVKDETLVYTQVVENEFIKYLEENNIHLETLSK